MKALLAAVGLILAVPSYANVPQSAFSAQASSPHSLTASPQLQATLLADEESGRLLEKWGPSKRELEIRRIQQLQEEARLAASAAAASGPLPITSWGTPLTSQRISSAFGLRRHPISGLMQSHSGVDLAAASGSPISATSAGVVKRAERAGGYGLLVTLLHRGGVETRYAHMSRINVLPGQKVAAGQVIGFVGSTGRSTGAHLHYEVRLDGRAVDPRFLQQTGSARGAHKFAR